MVRVKSCLLVVVMLFSFVLYGCDLLGGGSSESSSEIYTIMYSDGDEVHTLAVAYGELYTIERPFPSREGYDFRDCTMQRSAERSMLPRTAYAFLRFMNGKISFCIRNLRQRHTRFFSTTEKR